MNIKAKIGAGLAAASLIGSVVAPAAFADSIVIRGNGGGSDNDAVIKENKVNAVVQANITVVSNTVITTQNTGENQANGNTGSGGKVSVKSGNANSKVNISVSGNTNTASLPECDECEDNDSIVIRGNGKESDNDSKIKKNSLNLVLQGNATIVGNTVITTQNTGGNKANNNTGKNKKVSVKSGKTSSKVKVKVGGSTNNY